MAVVIDGSTGVSLVQDGVVTAADLASALDLSGKTVTLPAGVGGKILQVVQSTPLTGTIENGSSNWVTAGNMTITVTPQSSNSLLLASSAFIFGGSTNATNVVCRVITPNGVFGGLDQNGSSQTGINLDFFRHTNNGNTAHTVSFIHPYKNTDTTNKNWYVQQRTVSGSAPYGARIYGGLMNSAITVIEVDLS